MKDNNQIGKEQKLASLYLEDGEAAGAARAERGECDLLKGRSSYIKTVG
jgi:hypothetical protein